MVCWYWDRSRTNEVVDTVPRRASWARWRWSICGLSCSHPARSCRPSPAVTDMLGHWLGGQTSNGASKVRLWWVSDSVSWQVASVARMHTLVHQFLYYCTGTKRKSAMARCQCCIIFSYYCSVVYIHQAVSTAPFSTHINSYQKEKYMYVHTRELNWVIKVKYGQSKSW